MEDDFVGYSYTTPKGSTITVISESEGSKTTNRRYLSTCSVCSKDKELWPENFDKSKDTYLKQKVFCSCGDRDPYYTEDQFNVILKRCSSERGDGLKFLSIVPPEKGNIKKTTRVMVKCREGHITETMNISSYLNFKGYCNSCRGEAIRKTLSSKIDWLSEVRYSDLGTLRVEEEKGKHLYLRCDICSNDIELYPEPFKLHKSDWRAGKVPCGCSPYSSVSKEQYRVLCERASLGKGNVFVDFKGEWKGCDTKVIQHCPLHGEWDTSSVDKLVNGKRSCPDCSKENSTFGLYKHRRKDGDILYLIRLHSENENFIKVGRSFNLRERLHRYKAFYNIEVLSLLQMTHEEVFKVEWDLKRELKPLSYDPDKPFGGSVREVFTLEALDNSLLKSTFKLDC